MAYENSPAQIATVPEWVIKRGMPHYTWADELQRQAKAKQKHDELQRKGYLDDVSVTSS